MKFLIHGFAIFSVQVMVLHYTNNFWLFVVIAFLTGIFVSKLFNFFILFGIELCALAVVYLLSNTNANMLSKFSEISTLSPWLYATLVVLITAVLFASIGGTMISYRKAREIED